MAYQQGVRGTGSSKGQKRDTRYSKRCLECGVIYYKYVACSLKRWVHSKFCSTPCKGRYLKRKGVCGNDFVQGHTPAHKGKGKMIPCRGCGKLIPDCNRGHHCGEPDCRKASKTVHYCRIGQSLSKLSSRRGEGALALDPYLSKRGWVAEYVVPIAGRTFRLDFAKPDKKLYVEADGVAHQLDKEHDVERARLLTQDGWMGLRFWNREISANLPGVLNAIWN